MTDMNNYQTTTSVMLLSEDGNRVFLVKGNAQVLTDKTRNHARVRFLEEDRLDVLLEKMVERELAFFQDGEDLFMVYLSAKGKPFLVRMEAAK